MAQRAGLGYGECSHCGRRIGISERGLIRHHRPPGTWRAVCPGAGQRPHMSELHFGMMIEDVD